MGAAKSKGRTESVVDRDITSKLTKDQREGNARIKLLLLGPGESGKSAVFKQMKILYGAKPSDEELSRFIQVIHGNVIEAMQMLCDAIDEMGLSADLEAVDEFEAFRSADSPSSLSAPSHQGTKTIGDLVAVLWRDPAIQKAWARRHETQVVESHKVFLEDLDRIRSHSYTPTVKDSVLARVRSTGVITEVFEIQKIVFELYDVGGQRNERRKWIHVFDNVDAIIFVVSLSEYDQVCFEQKEQNRMVEAIELFKEICNHDLFKETDVILFLNKTDLFREKIVSHPIKDVELWKDYEGDGSFEDGWQYFRDKLVAVSGIGSHSRKEVFTHVTCATDTDNIHHVFNACRESILKAALMDSGLM